MSSQTATRRISKGHADVCCMCRVGQEAATAMPTGVAITVAPALPTMHPCVTFNLSSGKIKKNRKEVVIGATAFWLSCPHVNRVVGHFERGGAVHYFTTMVHSTPWLSASYAQSHDEYLQTVHRHIDHVYPASSDETTSITASSVHSRFNEVMKTKFGNAGVCTPQGVKCLHAQVALYLAGGRNPIARIAVNHMVVSLKMLLLQYEEHAKRHFAQSAGIATDSFVPAPTTTFVADEAVFQFPAIPSSSDNDVNSPVVRCPVAGPEAFPRDFAPDIVDDEFRTFFCTLCDDANRVYTGHQRHGKKRRT
eukprot:PhM_4_TR14407/c0_g1_i1/m.107100